MCPSGSGSDLGSLLLLLLSGPWRCNGGCTLACLLLWAPWPDLIARLLLLMLPLPLLPNLLGVVLLGSVPVVKGL